MTNGGPSISRGESPLAADGGPGGAPIGLVLFNLGGPDDQASVEPFLVSLFSDRDIIELPLGAITQPIFAWLIAKLRGPSVRANYALIGGGSPQLRLTRAQAAALEARMNGAASARYKTFLAMRYWHPSTEEALEAIAAAGIRRLVTLTLFPHWSKATTGSSQKELERVLALPRWRREGFTVTSVDRYADDPLYLDAFADTVRRALEGFPPGARERAVILWSAHGLPQKFIDQGDPYVGQIEATRRGLLERLGVSNREVLGYQSRTGPVKWIGPGTDEIIDELGREGVKELLVVPLSFVSDHIETLYEVDILFADRARAAGITDYRRPEALGTHPLFIEALAGLVERHVKETGA
jgi:ferrochelatase